jgi:threonine aldolase
MTEYTDKLREIANPYGLKLHVDGVRIFNASIAFGVLLIGLLVMLFLFRCLSKGLGALVRPVIVGSQTFIEKAKKLMKTLVGR